MGGEWGVSRRDHGSFHGRSHLRVQRPRNSASARDPEASIIQSAMTALPAIPPVTVAALAQVFDLTPGRVYQLEHQKVIPSRQRGKHDLVAATTAYIKNLQARAEGRGVEAQDVHTERARLTRARARRAELEADGPGAFPTPVR